MSKSEIIGKNVIKPEVRFWYPENNTIRVRQNQPNRDVYLTGCAKTVWETIVNNDYNLEQLADNLDLKFDKEMIHNNVLTLIKAGLLTTKNYLWQEES